MARSSSYRLAMENPIDENDLHLTNRTRDLNADQKLELAKYMILQQEKAKYECERERTKQEVERTKQIELKMKDYWLPEPTESIDKKNNKK
ncbi:unnamed protein product [Rotaria magnacalcarata]|uniref:Uncharacterized protein n=1 Tax=Rotaria magnacalcarata TaxID=392030 RepID=A0A816NSH9_9BILA|nr:unnamed protein product [Rotaria magnacalcarata]